MAGKTPTDRECRRWLVDAIRRFLIPAFEERGFVVFPMKPGDSDDRKFRLALPFGRLQRAGPNGIDQVEIELGAYGRPSVCLNFGSFPASGIDEYVSGKHFDAKDVWVGWLDEYYRMFSLRRGWRYFKVDRRWSRSIGPVDYEELVKRVVALIPEAEAALKYGTIGDHVVLGSGHETWLVDGIRKLLIPAFKRRGFEVVSLCRGGRAELLSGREGAGMGFRMQIAYRLPFGRLRRPGPKGLEIVEIEFGGLWGMGFRLNVGVVPPGGIDHPSFGHIAAEDVWTGLLDERYELYSRPLFRRRFYGHWLRGRTMGPARYEKLMQRVIGLIPEIEAALAHGTKGPHLRRVVGPRWKPAWKS